MTAIVGVVESGVAYIGGDSAVIGGSEGESSSITETKVFTVGPCAIGICGSVRAGNLVRHSLALPKYKAKMDAMAYVVTQVAGGIRNLLSTHGCLDGKGSSDEWDSQAIVGLAGRLFWIGSDFGVIEPVDGLVAAGGGGPYALGALRVLSPRNQRPRAVNDDLRALWRTYGSSLFSTATAVFPAPTAAARPLHPQSSAMGLCARALQVAARCSAYVSGPYWMVASHADGTVRQPYELAV